MCSVGVYNQKHDGIRVYSNADHEKLKREPMLPTTKIPHKKNYYGGP